MPAGRPKGSITHACWRGHLRTEKTTRIRKQGKYTNRKCIPCERIYWQAYKSKNNRETVREHKDLIRLIELYEDSSNN